MIWTYWRFRFTDYVTGDQETNHSQLGDGYGPLDSGPGQTFAPAGEVSTEKRGGC